MLRFYKGRKLRMKLRPVLFRENKRCAYVWPRCRLPHGVYTMKVYATDLAGNKQSRVGSARLTVK